MENVENLNINLEQDIDMQKLKEELRKKFSEYKKTMKFLAADAPVGILCLPVSVERLLADKGFLRIYDLLDVDLVKIEGLSVSRIRDLASRLDQFLSML